MKKIAKIAFVAMFGLAIGYTAYNSQKEEVPLSDIALDNVEALASGSESGSNTWYIYVRPEEPGYAPGYNCWTGGRESC